VKAIYAPSTYNGPHFHHEEVDFTAALRFLSIYTKIMGQIHNL
jgi:hypothetical protein